MRHYDYQLTLTLPATESAPRGPRTALVRESLEIADTAISWTRRYRIDAVSRSEPVPAAARWTPEEEDSRFHAA